MKRTRHALWALVFVALAAATAWGQDQPAEKPPVELDRDHAGIKLTYWAASYNGNIKVEDRDVFGGTGTIKGGTFNLENDLGVENPRGVPEISAWIRLGQRNRIILSYFFATYNGSKRLKTNQDFAGYTFSAATDLDTEFRFSRTVFMWQYNPLLTERGRLGLMVGMEYYLWRFAYDGRDVTSGVRVSKDVVLPLPVPVVGIEGEVALGAGFGLQGSLSGIGMKLNVMDVQASYTDLDLGITYDYQALHAAVGYRTINTIFKGKDDQRQKFDVNFSHAGWMATVGVNI